MNPVYARLAFYALSGLLSLIPASLAGWVSYDAATHMLQIDVEAFVAFVITGLGASGAVFAKWGKK